MDFFESFAVVSQAPEPTFRLCGSEAEGRVRDHLTHLGSHKPLSPDGLQLQALMELADVFARPPSITSKDHGKEVGSQCLGKGKYRTYLQKMKENVGKLQPRQSHLIFWNSGPGSPMKEKNSQNRAEIVIWRISLN